MKIFQLFQIKLLISVLMCHLAELGLFFKVTIFIGIASEKKLN